MNEYGLGRRGPPGLLWGALASAANPHIPFRVVSPEFRAASNDSDSELEETPDPLDSSVDSALRRLSFLEVRGGTELVESEELPGAGQGHWEGLSGHNTNQSNNKVPPVRLRVARSNEAVASRPDRQPQFV